MKSRPSVFSALIFFVFLVSVCAPRAQAAPRPLVDPELVLWTNNLPAAVVGSPALNVDGTTLYVATLNRSLHALDVETGEIFWTRRLPAAPTSPCTISDDGLIFVGCANGVLYGISDQGDSGSIDFTSFLGGNIASPAIDDDGIIYAGTSGNHLFSLRGDGSKVWVYNSSNDVRTPIIADDRVYFVSGGFVIGVSFDTGGELSLFTPRSAINNTPALGDEGRVYFGANDSRVYALNSEGDTNDWRYHTGKNVMSSPAVGADGSIYIGSDSARIISLNSNGIVRWKVATGAPVRSALSIGVDGTIYAGCDDRRLYAISSAGELLWTKKTKAAVRSSPALDAFGVVYFTSGRSVYAIQTDAQADDFDEAPWPMFRKDRLHTARATECRPFLILEPGVDVFHEDDGTTTRESSLSVTNGESVSISIVVRAGAPITYQWQLNGEDIDPADNRTATNSTFVINSVDALDAGIYTVTAFNDCGEVESDSFSLNVDSPPIITSQPTNVFTLAGNTVTLRVGVVGTLPITYQWKKDDVAIPGATNATFVITNAQPSDSSSNYYVMVMNRIGDVPYATNSTTVVVQVFAVTLGLSDRSIGAGHRHSLAVISNQTLWAWGLDNFGQLGDNQSGNSGTNFVLRSVPTVIVGTNAASSNVWASVSGGSRPYNPATNQPGGFSLGLQTNGSLWAWGLNDRGQLGISSTNLQRVPTRVGTDTNWVQVEAGATHSIGLKRDGSIWTWGGNEFGQLGIGSTDTNSTAPIRVGTDSAWVEVRAGGYFSLARRADGTIWAWGTNRFGELGVGLSANTGTNSLRRMPVQIGTNTDWAGISAGAFHALAVKTDGTIWAWGRNHFGQLGIGGTADGRETQNTNRPALIGTSSNWTTVEAGSFHSFAINSSGGLFAWGANFYGQLGNGEIGPINATNEANRSTPVAVAGEMTWRFVDASDHSLGQTTDGRIWGWGLNNFGQVGDGTGGDGTRNNNRSTPVLIAFNISTNNTATNPPVITSQPTSQTVLEGGTATFSIGASGASPLVYQWFFNSVAISSATNFALQVADAQGANVGSYFAVVTNQFGRATSTVVTLSVTNSSGQPLGPTNAPVFTQQPVAQVSGVGSTVSFSVTATGAPPIAYQWYFSTNLLASQSNATLVLTNILPSDARFYFAVATNSVGSVTSAVAGLTITNTNGLVFFPSDGVGSGTDVSNSAPFIVQEPTNQTVAASNDVSLTVGALGREPLFYQWYIFNSPINAATNATAATATLTITNIRSSAPFKVVVSNSLGVVTSAQAVVTVSNTLPPFDSKALPVSTEVSELRLQSMATIGGSVIIGVSDGGPAKRLVLEYKDSLRESEWKSLSTNDAGELKLTDPSPPMDRSRFYRVRAE